MKIFDVQLEFFRPLWRRVVVVGISVGWAIVEIWIGTPLWAALFAALAAYCIWQFFFVFNPKPDRSKDPKR